jgi:hypothetical protein
VCSARGAGAPQQERKTMKTLLFNLTFYPSINHSQPRSDGLFPPLARPGTGLRWPPGYVGNRGRPAGLRHGTRGSRAATCVPQGAWWGRLSVQHSSSELPFETAAPFPDREESNGVAVQRRLFPHKSGNSVDEKYERTFTSLVSMRGHRPAVAGTLQCGSKSMPLALISEV